METLDLQEAAAFLRMSPEALRQKAKAGLIPGFKPAKQWVFIKEDLVECIRSGYDLGRQVSRTGEKKWQKNCSVEVKAKSGITASRHREAASKFEEALTQMTKR